MNYFAHGQHFLDDPYFLAGTALPDWLSAADRLTRLRSKQAVVWIDDPDPRVASLARGLTRHHADDAWFHSTPAFAELSMNLAVEVRAALPPDDSPRGSFLGHILVEILLDDCLIAENPTRLDEYYAALAGVDPDFIEATVNRMAVKPTQRLSPFITMFRGIQFLRDYSDDGKLWWRLNQIMRRVRLPEAPESFREVLGPTRRRVASRVSELLPRDRYGVPRENPS